MSTNLKTVADFQSHVEANAPAVGRGKIMQWFKDQIAAFIASAGGAIDKDTFEAMAKKLFDTVVKPNDGIPDFIDEILWSVVILPLIDKQFAKHSQPAGG